MLFIDLRNRTDQRRKFQEEKKKEKKKDVLAELKRKAKDTIDAEMAQLEKRCQCSCLSAFAIQCCEGLVWLLPLSAQLWFRRERTKRQITKDADKKKNKFDDKDKRQLDEEEKIDKEKKMQAKVTARSNIGETRIQEARIEFDDFEKSLHEACGAKACDTLDVCTVAFFMAVRSME